MERSHFCSPSSSICEAIISLTNVDQCKGKNLVSNSRQIINCDKWHMEGGKEQGKDKITTFSLGHMVLLQAIHFSWVLKNNNNALFYYTNTGHYDHTNWCSWPLLAYLQLLYIALSPKCGYVILTFFSSLQHLATFLYAELKPREHEYKKFKSSSWTYFPSK